MKLSTAVKTFEVEEYNHHGWHTIQVKWRGHVIDSFTRGAKDDVEAEFLAAGYTRIQGENQC